MSSFTAFSGRMMTYYDHEASKQLGGDHWRVTESFRYYVGGEGSNRWVTVPAGYLTDGASVPRLFWNIIPPWGPHGQAAVVHDLLCEYLQLVDNGMPVSITRAECDRILLEAMEVLEVPWLRRRTMYAAVSAYRILARIDEPSNTLFKRTLESEWGVQYFG